MRALAIALALLPAVAAAADRQILSAEYAEPTDAYPHGALGDDREWGALLIEEGVTAGKKGGLFSGSASLTWRLREDEHVFEDTEPRMWDVTGDGLPEVVVVQSSFDKGARLVVYGIEDGELWKMSTAYIGERFRWMAPFAAGDLDGDGLIEIAVIDRPHLAKVLRLFQVQNDRIVEVAYAAGFTNHRFGETAIQGGLRACDGTPELIVAAAEWEALIAVRWGREGLTARRVSSDTSPEGFAAALECR